VFLDERIIHLVAQFSIDNSIDKMLWGEFFDILDLCSLFPREVLGEIQFSLNDFPLGKLFSENGSGLLRKKL